MEQVASLVSPSSPLFPPMPVPVSPVGAVRGFRPVFAGRSVAGALSPQWLLALRELGVALQPLVSIHSSHCLGYEAFVRGMEGLGYASTAALLDAAARSDCLPEVDVALLEKAVLVFLGLPEAQEPAGHALKLFLNLDGRSLAYGERLLEPLERLLTRYHLGDGRVVLELSSRHPILSDPLSVRTLEKLRALVGHVAIDDFGDGYAGLPLLHAARPDYVKIGRFFISDLGKDPRKKMFLRHTVNLAHLLGVQVVAESVESEREFFACKDVGCDVVQGFAVATPHLHAVSRPEEAGRQVALFNAHDRRHAVSDLQLIQAEISYIPPISIDADLGDVFDHIRREDKLNFMPVVNAQGEPLGILRECELKGYAYSPFGRELLANKGYGRQVSSFLVPSPVADVNTRAEKILEIFSADEDSEGLLMVEDGRYVGFLSARSLLRILNEKNLAAARDQNPLTRLPGNARINSYLADAVADRNSETVVVYIDFDNFKPFNDTYGFRQGDRAITLFAEIITKDLPHEGTFVGHIGGDDFFAAFRDLSFAEAAALVRHVTDRFRQEVESFYDAEARQRGYILAKDREGVEKRMPLLAASAALVCLGRNHTLGSIDDISSLIATMKKEAKASPDKQAAVSIVSFGMSFG